MQKTQGITLEECTHHGFNLMVTVVLLFSGLAFGTVAFSPVEDDWFDRADDIGLLLVGLIGLAWFLIGRNRYQHTVVPVVLAGFAMGFQTLAILFERDSQASFGDNIGSLIILIPFFFFTLVYYLSMKRNLADKKGNST
jgi:hypothetical protein